MAEATQGTGRLFIKKSVDQCQREATSHSLKRTLGPLNLVLLGIGCILSITAGFLARETKSLLIGEKASPEMEADVLKIARSEDGLRHANGVLPGGVRQCIVPAQRRQSLRHALTIGRFK